MITLLTVGPFKNLAEFSPFPDVSSSEAQALSQSGAVAIGRADWRDCREGGGYAAGLSRYQWRKQSSVLMRDTEMCGTGVRRIALEPLAPIPATKPGSLVKTGKSIPIKGCGPPSDALGFLEIIIHQKPTAFFMALIVYYWISTGDAF